MNVHEADAKLKEIHRKMYERALEGKSNMEPTRCVQIVHNEGTTLFYHSAFAVKYEDYWFVITEHHDSIFYHEDEVLIRQYNRIWGDEDKLPWE